MLGVGSNTTLLLRLLWYSARFAPCEVIHSSLNSVTAACTKDNEGNIWVNGGSLLMARGGVCVLGDFSKFKKESQESVCRGELSEVYHKRRIFMHENVGTCYKKFLIKTQKISR